jgi:hypothetical protein
MLASVIGLPMSPNGTRSSWRTFDVAPGGRHNIGHWLTPLQDNDRCHGYLARAKPNSDAASASSAADHVARVRAERDEPVWPDATLSFTILLPFARTCPNLRPRNPRIRSRRWCRHPRPKAVRHFTSAGRPVAVLPIGKDHISVTSPPVVSSFRARCLAPFVERPRTQHILYVVSNQVTGFPLMLACCDFEVKYNHLQQC